MGKNVEQAGIVIYWEAFELLDELEPVEAKEMLAAIHAYSRFAIEPDFAENRVLRIVWKSIKAGIDRNLEKYEQTKAARSAAGKASAEKRAEQASTNATNVAFVEQDSTEGNAEQQKQLSKTKTNSGTNSETKTETGTRLKEREKKERENAAAPFVPPTQAEVAEYCRERGNDIDPARFIAVNAAKGWMIGNTQIADWKALIPAWEKTQYKQRDKTDKPVMGAQGATCTADDMARLAKMRQRMSQQSEAAP